MDGEIGGASRHDLCMILRALTAALAIAAALAVAGGTWYASLDKETRALIAAIVERTGCRLGDARVLHFNVGQRPWDTASLATVTDPRVASASACSTSWS